MGPFLIVILRVVNRSPIDFGFVMSILGGSFPRKFAAIHTIADQTTWLINWRSEVMKLLMAIGLQLLLGSFAYSADIHSLTNDLVQGSAQEQQDSMSELGKGGPSAVQAMLSIVEGENSREAHRRAGLVLEALFRDSSNRSEESLARLSRLTQHSDSKRVEIALTKLMMFKANSTALQSLKYLATTHKNKTIRAKAFGAIMVQTGRDKRETAFFEEAFEQEGTPYVKAWIAGYLGSLGSKKGMSFCQEVLRDPGSDLSVKVRAAIAAGKIADSSLIPALQSIQDASGPEGLEARMALKNIELVGLKDTDKKIAFLDRLSDDPIYSRWALNSLADMGDVRAAAQLQAISADSSRSGSAEAKVVLARESPGQ